MLRKLVRRLLQHRHFWRDVDFNELSEIYVTSMFRSLTLSLIGIFAPLYMLRLGYSIQDFLLVLIAYFAARALLFDWFAGLLVSRIGAKHTLFSGYALLLVSAAQFLTLPNIPWPLWMLGAAWGGSTSLYAIPFHVDFSKIKHPVHGGKELGYVNIMVKIGGVIGPLFGGIVAVWFGGQYIFLVAMVLLLVGGIPLLRTAEPVPARQPLRFVALPFRTIQRDILSVAAYGVELTLSGSLWPLYLAVFVLSGSAAYAKLGLIASVSVIASIAIGYTIGLLVDRHHGRRILRMSAIFNACLHLVQPMLYSFVPALFIGAADDAASLCYQLPLLKGIYDRGDELDGNRAAYFTLLEGLSSFVKLAVWIALLVLANMVSAHSMMAIGFAVAAAASLLIMIERFKALNP